MTGRHHSRKQQPVDTALDDARLMRAGLSIAAAYLFLGFMPLMRWSLAHHQWWPIAVHVGALATTIFFALGDQPRRFRPVRDWLGLGLIFFMYFDLRYIVAGIGMAKKDDRIASLDQTLFGDDLWRSLATRLHSAPLSELLHLSYLSYYPLIALPPFLLWRKERRHEFTVTMVTLIVTYVLCFSGSILVPVDGPRFVYGPAAAPAGPVRALALLILKVFSSHGAAFPSSHVAAGVAATVCALRFQRRVGIAALISTIGLAAGAVYGGLHYATDIVAGIVVGAAGVGIAYLIERRRTRHEHHRREEPVPADLSGKPVKVQIMQQRMLQHSQRRSRSLRPSKEIREEDLPTPPPPSEGTEEG